MQLDHPNYDVKIFVYKEIFVFLIHLFIYSLSTTTIENQTRSANLLVAIPNGNVLI